MMTIADINALSEAAFVARFGFLFEHSQWVVEAAADGRPFADLAAMESAMMANLQGEGEAAVLAVLRAHPVLAGHALLEKTLTASSAAEQKSAGLDRLTAEEVETFAALNAAYQTRFGFPFIICARLTSKEGIQRSLQERLSNAPQQEIEMALAEVAKIVHLRLREACA